MPAVSLAAVPGRRQRTLELARELEQRGFAGIYCPSFSDGMSLSLALAHTTERIPFGTSIANIYARNPLDYAQSASFIHEVSGGRFRFGVGVSHATTHARLGVRPGRPLDDMRSFVDTVRGAQAGDMPPIVLATLRKGMVRLAGKIAEGVVWANGARSHMAESLAELPPDKRNDERFFIGNMIPTCISGDRPAAAEVMRRTLIGYAALPNYNNYWREAGYADEMSAIREAATAGDRERVASLMTDDWLSDVTLYGTVSDVRDGLEAWFDAGVRTPILVPSSTQGGQMQAFQELFDTFS